MALLLIVAFAPLFRALIQTGLQSIPLVGGWIASHTDQLLFSAYARAVSWALPALSPFTDFIRRLRVGWFLWSDKAVHLMVEATLAAWRLRWQWLPWTLDQANAYANQVYSWSVAFTVSIYQRATQYADYLHALETQFAEQVYSWSVAFTVSIYQRATQYADYLHALQTAYAQAIGTQAIRYAQQLAGQAADYARALHAQAIGFAEDAFGRAIEYEQRLYGDATRYAERLAQADRAYTQAVGAQALAYAATATGVIAAELADLQQKGCIRYCSPLGDLGALLQGLEDLGLAALLVALAEESIRNPGGTSQLLQELVGQPARALAQATGGELGLRVT